MLGMFLGHWEILVVLVIALLLFGKRLPEVARNMGKGIVEFKKGVKGVEDDIEYRSVEPPPPSYSDSPSPSSEEGSNRDSEVSRTHATED